MTKPGKYLRAQRAQTAMELAVFGAILIFVVGAIVRQAMSAGYMQNQQLRAMRQAMSTSYRYSNGLLGGGGGAGNASHQSAQILFIEDRLTAESAKYGAIDRTPFVVGASGTYSRNLFLPVDANEDYNLPIYDVFINGKHFPFTTARFRTVELARPCSGVLPANCASYPKCKGSCGAGSFQLYPSAEIYPGGPPVEWEDNCITIETTVSTCTPGDCIAACPDFGNNCTVSPGPPITNTQQVGCAKLYDVIYNHPSYLEWCDDDAGGTLCPVSLCRDICNPNFCNAGAGDCDAASAVTFPENFTADERFDLDRSGPPGTPDPDVPGVLGTARGDFFWQWYLVMGADAGYIMDMNSDPLFADATINRGAGIVMEPSSCKKDCAPSQHTVIDVDGDLKRERMMVDSKQVDSATGVMKSFVVMDMQDGDLDFTRGDSDTGPEPGLQKDTKMYSFVRDAGADGTYLFIEEGILYDPADGQFIRTTQKKDQIDLIERVFQLSNDTGRFCDAGGNPVADGTDPWTGGQRNPVEACNNCFSGANIQRTCMDQANKLIFVRSRVADRRGRKWITSTSGDDYVDFTLPPGP